MRKILFLDIDGVLNSQRTCVANRGYPHDFSDEDHPKFDWTAVQLVRKAQHICRFDIVLSSSWRLMFSPQEVSQGLGLHIIDRTPSLNFPVSVYDEGSDHRQRGEEIQHFLDQLPEEVSYVILDDDSDMLESQMPRFVKTDYEEGFSFKNFKEVVYLFEGKDFYGID